MNFKTSKLKRTIKMMEIDNILIQIEKNNYKMIQLKIKVVLKNCCFEFSVSAHDEDQILDK